MPLGQATQVADYDKPPPEALAAVQKALGMIGHVTSADEDGLSVQGTSRYGLQKVRMEVTVTRKGQSSTITLVALSDDVWAAGAKNCNKRLLEALQNLDNPDYVPSKSGMGLVRLVLIIVGLVLVLFLVQGGMQFLPGWVTATVCLFGLCMLVYFAIAKATFGKK